tara:strand:- start:126 stop:488 length:363 start_codon:yes stop_codon:yes gene_type:complete
MFLYFDFLINVGGSKRSPGCVGRGALDLNSNHANTKENMMKDATVLISLNDLKEIFGLVNSMSRINHMPEDAKCVLDQLYCAMDNCPIGLTKYVPACSLRSEELDTGLLKRKETNDEESI